jgi:hypothetical protein
LQLVQQPAQADFVNKVLMAPKPAILFNTDTADGDNGFVQYLAQRQHISQQEATERLTAWCTQAKAQLQQQGQLYLTYIGTLFQKGQQLSFTQANLPAVFLPVVAAERVVHPEADHSMLVGDKETTTVQMTEYLAGNASPKKRWWIAALVLAAVALGLCALQLGQNNWKRFGTAGGYLLQPTEIPVLHQTIP